MNPKTFKKICGAACFLGFLLMVGSVGASDLETITLKRAIIQSLVGLVMFGSAGLWGGYIQ